MNKAAALLLVFTSVLLIFMITGTLLVNSAEGNMMPLLWYPDKPDTTPPQITIYSPLPNQTFASTVILLNFTVTKPTTWFSKTNYSEDYMPGTFYCVGRVVSYNYSLDGNESQNIPAGDLFHLASSPNETLIFSSNLSLPIGAHNLTINLECQSGYYLPFEANWPLSVTFYEQSPVLSFFVTNLSGPTPPSSPTFPTVPVIAQQFSMPEEQVNYTVTQINGTMWSKIDGAYPIMYAGKETLIPMVYPIPPETNNISIWINNSQLSWSNFTETNPKALHHTGIGDWSEILTLVNVGSGSFVLRIHYEHPLQVINGSYVFLYDLNIQEYLSAACNSSVAHFTIAMDVNYTNLKVNTVDPETETLKPIEYVTLGDKNEVVKVDEVSEFGKTLPGDLLVSFSLAKMNDIGTLSVVFAATSVTIVAVVVAALVYWKKRKPPLAHSELKPETV